MSATDSLITARAAIDTATFLAGAEINDRRKDAIRQVDLALSALRYAREQLASDDLLAGSKP